MKVDWSRIESLIDPNEPGDQAWMKDMMENLYQNMETRIRNVKEFLDSKRMDELRSELHQIKGVAANFGLTELFENVQAAEALIKEGRSEESLPLAVQTESIWLGTKKELMTRYP